MTCDRAREAILDALVEPLDQERRRALRQHVGSCSACRAEAAEFEEIWSCLGIAAIPAPAADALERFEARLRSELRSDPGEPAPPQDADEGRRSSGWATLLRRSAAVLALMSLGAVIAVGLDVLRRPTAPSVEGQRYMLIMTATTEPPEQSGQVAEEMGEWMDRLREQGVLVSVSGLESRPPVGTPPGGSIVADSVVGVIVIRAADDAEARRITASCPSIRYGGFVELRALN